MGNCNGADENNRQKMSVGSHISVVEISFWNNNAIYLGISRSITGSSTLLCCSNLPGLDIHLKLNTPDIHQNINRLNRPISF